MPDNISFCLECGNKLSRADEAAPTLVFDDMKTTVADASIETKIVPAQFQPPPVSRTILLLLIGALVAVAIAVVISNGN